MDSLSPTRLPYVTLGPEPSAVARNSRHGENPSAAAVATNFESMFLSLLLKEMRQTLEPGGLFGNDSADIHGGLFDLFLGQHLAQAGGIGLASMLRHQLKTTTPHEPSSSQPPSPP